MLQFPFLCPYNDATYSIIVADDEGKVIARDGPYFISWRQQSSTVSIKIRLGISTASKFTANITVTTGGGHSLTCFSFSKFAAMHTSTCV